MNEYVIAFSSFYRAIYAQEKLQEHHIKSVLKKVPPNVLKSCGYAINLRAESIDPAMKALEESQITARAVYLIETINGSLNYRQIV